MSHAALWMCEYLPELHNAAAAVDTRTAASASVGEAYAAVAAWPDTAKRDDQRKHKDILNIPLIQLWINLCALEYLKKSRTEFQLLKSLYICLSYSSHKDFY